MASEDSLNLLQNLETIVNDEEQSINDLVDIEVGLIFAENRLLDLKQIQLEYLNNPLYISSGNCDSEKILEACDDIVKSLLLHELSEINSKLYY